MSDAVKRAIGEAVVNALIPLAQLAAERGIGVGDFYRYLDLAFVRAMDREAAEAGRPLPADSDIEVRTGIGRMQVPRIRAEDVLEPQAPMIGQPRTLQVIWGWQHDKDFVGPDHEPRSLPLRGPASFKDLVMRYGVRGIRPGSILRELERTKAIRHLKEGQIALIVRNDTDVQRRVQAIQEFGVCAGEFAETLLHNIRNPAMPRYHRRVVNERVKDGTQVARIARDAAVQAEVFASGVQDALMDRSITAKAGEESKARHFSTHVFFCERPTHLEPRPGDLPPSKAAGKGSRQQRTRRVARVQR
jgi:hypothetical protein